MTGLWALCKSTAVKLYFLKEKPKNYRDRINLDGNLIYKMILNKFTNFGYNI